jgi:hypothetical protein
MFSRTLKSTSPFTVSLAILFGKRARQCDTSSSNPAKQNGSKRRLTKSTNLLRVSKNLPYASGYVLPVAGYGRWTPLLGVLGIFFSENCFSESMKRKKNAKFPTFQLPTKMRRTTFDHEAQEGERRLKRQRKVAQELRELHSERSIHDTPVPTAVLYLVRWA